MKISPTTRPGKWSLILLVSSILLFTFTTLVIVGIFKQEGGETFTDNPFISIPMITASVLIAMAFVDGVFSIWKYKERSLLVYISTGLCLLITMFLISDLTTPH